MPAFHVAQTRFLLVTSVVLGLVAGSASAAAPGTGWYKLQTQFQAPKNKCLEGNKNDPKAVLGGAAFMDKCQDVSGQLWKFVPEGNTGFYRLKTQFQGEDKCLEGNKYDFSTGVGGGAFMDTCQNVSGQLWKLVPIKGGSYKLKTQFQGPNKCLEGNQFPNPEGKKPGANAVQKGAAFMDKCQNVSGQSWQLVDASAKTVAPAKSK